MTTECLNATGLILNIIGVILAFFFAFPQPSHEEGVGRVIEDATLLPDGRTVAQHDEDVRKKKKFYLCMSRFALTLIIIGFAFQLYATLR